MFKLFVKIYLFYTCLFIYSILVFLTFSKSRLFFVKFQMDEDTYDVMIVAGDEPYRLSDSLFHLAKDVGIPPPQFYGREVYCDIMVLRVADHDTHSGKNRG